ncbi:hypothetical protein [Photobacterium phosphoreum]|jgi:hypothetical protein|uniref:Uncharacterized protein n=1 Tax=Photobacterium phosphoreum TaxID=659 RepID=A0A2T3PIV2_PHOPO|nr:hypothetical protein [Photobacterium phosphoreum]MCD9465227.1 hypothetical protein [Photobacterium phosphoreum]MCD9472381.1 hypothetical protein [Photobacterium phosphoreum]MCD9476415.1 hypothetical protein [Photobacterium phosphoreum]MCD9480787.1 hypothetical protein [Photobacterium phosphoreum]MCD9503820.1 hypothetical protein [Photobacterium phosphoreum]
MLTSIDRVMIYAVLCIISFSTIMLTSHHSTGLFAIGGLLAAILGLWVELSNKDELEQQKNQR